MDNRWFYLVTVYNHWEQSFYLDLSIRRERGHFDYFIIYFKVFFIDKNKCCLNVVGRLIVIPIIQGSASQIYTG